jgi:phosphoglycolate phosphatase
MQQALNNIQNLLFDLDGTLVDSSRTIGICVDYALGRLGISAAGGLPVASVIGTPLLDIFRKQYEMTDEQADSAVAHYREHYDRLNQAGTEVYDSIPDVLSTLRQEGFRLFIATVKPTSVAEKVLNDLGLRPYFDGVAGASMGHERRDKASIIAHALRLFDLEPAHSVMIGDRDQDIIGAREHGLPCIAVSYGFGTRDELDSARPAHVVGHSTEILSLLVNPFRA